MVVAELSGLGTEANVGNVGDGGRVVDVEALGPVVLVLVLELQLELLVLEVREAQLSVNIGVADSTSRAAGELAVLAVVALVVRLVAVAVHGHDVREDNARAVVLVSIDKDAQSLEAVGASKDIALLAALSCDPHGEAVAIELVFARDFKFNFNLPVCCRQWDAGEEPTGLRRAVRRKTDISAKPKVC